jgi:hypothetical protein
MNIVGEQLFASDELKLSYFNFRFVKTCKPSKDLNQLKEITTSVENWRPETK